MEPLRPSRRSILTSVAAGAGIALGLPSLATSAWAADPVEPPPFDWDTGNASFSIVVSQTDPILLDYLTVSDAPLIIRLNALIAIAMYDAIAPYHPTAVGIHSRLGRRPASEALTNRNKNLALVYACYRVFLAALPLTAHPRLRAVLTANGLDPDDNHEDTTTAIGIGNKAGNAVVAARSHDGSNMLGDVGWGQYNRQQYRDYTGYQPVNTSTELKDPSRWQPAIVTNGGGTYKIQKAATPQFGRMTAYTYGDVRRFLLPPPADSDYRNNRRGYREQAEVVLARSAALTDELKMKAEIFNDKLLALGYSVGIAGVNAHLDLDDMLLLNLVTAIAAFDANIACWFNKFHHDAVRPFSAIHLLFARDRVAAWGGPGVGTVTDLRGDQWASFIGVADHPEYPSTTTTLCNAHAQAARRFLGTDALDLTYPVAKGSSHIEPGITPAQDMNIHYSTWTEFAHDCGQARINGGVHFPGAVAAGEALGPQFGDMAYEFVMSHVNGHPVN